MAERSAHTGPDDLRSPGPCCTSPTAGSAGAATVADMATVVAGVLSRSPLAPGAFGALDTPDAPSAHPHADTARAAQALLPAIVALDGLANRLAHDTAPGTCGTKTPGLAGLIHRRCRVAPADARGHAGGAGLRRAVRGDWELIHSTTWVPDAGPAWTTGAVVTHDLARRTTSSSLGSPLGADGHAPGLAPGPAPELTLAAVDLRAWARATGDHNPIHLHPGAALRAGIPVGEGDVVAHGLLLGAISLALVPASGAVNLRFTGAAPLPAEGSTTLRVDVDGAISVRERTVLVRR